MSNFTFKPAAWDDKPVLSRLLELYQYDMTPYWPQELNAHGEYEIGRASCRERV